MFGVPVVGIAELAAVVEVLPVEVGHSWTNPFDDTEKFVTGVPKNENAKPEGRATSGEETSSPTALARAVAVVMSSHAVGVMTERTYEKYGMAATSNVPVVVPLGEPTAMVNVWLVKALLRMNSVSAPADVVELEASTDEVQVVAPHDGNRRRLTFSPVGVATTFVAAPAASVTE